MSQRKEKLSVDRSVKTQHTWVGLPRVGHPVFGRLCPSLIPVMAVARLLTLGQLRCQVVARVVSQQPLHDRSHCVLPASASQVT